MLAQSDMVFEIIWDGTFQRRMEDRAHVIATYERHNQAVIDALPADRLLVYRTGDGWPPLCEFLGVPVPETPYPQVNSTEDFQRMVGMRND